MSATNSTANYGLPIFVSSDVPSWLTDWNGAMGDIDSAIAAAKATADSALLASGNNTTDITTIQGQITTISGTLSTHTTQIGTISGNINTINSLVGNGTPTTTDQTIIGAINELAAIVEPDSVEVTADGVKTYGALLGEIQAAMDYSKLSYRSVFDLIASNGSHTPFRTTTHGASLAAFDNTTDGGSGKIGNYHIILTSGNDKYTYQDGSTETVLTNNAAPSGMKLKLIY